MTLGKRLLVRKDWKRHANGLIVVAYAALL